MNNIVISACFIVCSFFVFCNQGEIPNIAMGEYRSMASASDVDESNAISNELIKQTKRILDSSERKLIFYTTPEKHKLIYDFYEITEEQEQTNLANILRLIKKNLNIEKTIILKFFLKENLVQTQQGFYREEEILLKELEI